MQKYKHYQRLRDLREDKDITQKEAAEIIKAGTTQYRRYESAETAISLEQAEIYADFYKVSLDYIAGRTNNKKGIKMSELPDDETELISMYRELSERGKGEIIGTIKNIHKNETEETAKRKDVI